VLRDGARCAMIGAEAPMNKNVAGWVVFIGVIIGLNVLSHVFGWGFRFY
jgi:exosortase/archaeosortase